MTALAVCDLAPPIPVVNAPASAPVSAVTVRDDGRAERFADYDVIRPLAAGEHSRILVATAPARLVSSDRAVGEQVVLKVIAGGDHLALRRSTRELRQFSGVDDLRLVRLFEAGRHEQSFFYSMEWCRGGSLAAPTAELDRASHWQAIAQAAAAAHALHEFGIAHRHIRPSHVLLRSTGSGAVDACLADTATTERLPRPESNVATAPLRSIGYTDPALLLGAAPGRASDVYALGAVAHRVVTGAHLHPIDAALTAKDVMLGVRAVLRHPPQLHRQLLSDDEADLIAACVDHDLRRRPPTAGEVAAVAQEIADSLAVR